MGASDYNSGLSWVPNEILTDEKLNAMVANDDWNKLHKVEGQYGAFGLTVNQGVRILTGTVQINPNGKSASNSASVNFGTYFSEGCNPIVTTSVYSTSQRMIFPTVEGPSGEAYPTRAGFKATGTVWAAKAANAKITKLFYIAWTAVGY